MVVGVVSRLPPIGNSFYQGHELLNIMASLHGEVESSTVARRGNVPRLMRRHSFSHLTFEHIALSKSRAKLAALSPKSCVAGKDLFASSISPEGRDSGLQSRVDLRAKFLKLSPPPLRPLTCQHMPWLGCDYDQGGLGDDVSGLELFCGFSQASTRSACCDDGHGDATSTSNESCGSSPMGGDSPGTMASISQLASVGDSSIIASKGRQYVRVKELKQTGMLALAKASEIARRSTDDCKKRRAKRV